LTGRKINLSTTAYVNLKKGANRMSIELTVSQNETKEQFIKERGKWKWSELWETILVLDEEILKAYSSLSSVPNKKGYVEPKIKEFIYIAIDASITHLHAPGIRGHIRHALELGATSKEIMEVIEITSTLGSHTLTVGIPSLVDILQKRGMDISGIELTERQKEIKDDYIRDKGGYWSDELQTILKLDEEIFEAFAGFSNVPWNNGCLEPKTKELIYIAINASATTLHEPELKIHIENALNAGATKEEILEVFEMVSCLGVHSITIGVPILKEECDEGGY